MAKVKQPKDVNQLAKSIVDTATNVEPPKPLTEEELIKAAASALGRKGGFSRRKRQSKGINR